MKRWRVSVEVVADTGPRAAACAVELIGMEAPPAFPMKTTEREANKGARVKIEAIKPGGAS